jgi:hypothetical protein
MALTQAKRMVVLLIAVAVWLPAISGAWEYRIQSRADWEAWTRQGGVVEVLEDGSIGLKRIRKNIDAVANAAEFEHLSKDTGGLVRGGLRNAGSNAAMAALALDGDPETWWQPAMDDEAGDWWLEIDLGRLVLGNRLRLVFADKNGARPFRRFAVYISDGERKSLKADVFQYTRAFVTIDPNTRTVVDLDLHSVDPDKATGDFLVATDTLDFAPVQYVRFIAETQEEGAALAEIEVWTPGDNIALGNVLQGGVITAGTDGENADKLADGDINSFWTQAGGVNRAQTYEAMGTWYEWDLGASFWVDRLVSIEGHTYGIYFATSDGTALVGSSGEGLASGHDYLQLTEIFNSGTVVDTRFDLQFPRRRVKSIFYHVVPHVLADGRPAEFLTKVREHMIFGEGYPAAARMTSGYLDFQGEKSISNLRWEAETPPGTTVKIRTRTGDSFEVDTYYYTKSGKEITKAFWGRLPKSQKAPPVEIIRPAADWSGWSPVYSRSGEGFLSPSPRRYAQLSVELLSDDPDAAASLRSIVLDYSEPLLRRGATGLIQPREAMFDTLQEFRYSIQPVLTSGDAGFDRVIIRVPSPAVVAGLRIGTRDVAPLATEMVGDSLIVDLPQVVLRDSVEVRFLGSLTQTTTEFSAWLWNSRTGTGQGVRPAAIKATTVYVPAVAAGGLIRNVKISPSLITPNGDGRNDVATVRLTAAKVHTDPEVLIYTLGGAYLRRLQAIDGSFGWDGRDEAGALVPPGVYICRIRVPADAGDETVYRTIGVVY